MSKGNGTTTIGYKRIICFPTIQASKIRFTVNDAKACPIIANIEVYNALQILTAPAIIRNQAGEITITPSDIESTIFYTLDGSEPTAKSTKYNNSFATEGKLEIKAIAFDPATGKSSPVTHEHFDISRSLWKIDNINDPKASRIIDGDPHTNWHQGRDTKLPADLVIDLGKEEKIAGFRYLPDQGMWGPGIITHYQFFVSADGNSWELADEGEFSNIKNNPLWQTKRFNAKKARYIKLTSLENTEGNNNIGYAEIDVITE